MRRSVRIHDGLYEVIGTNRSVLIQRMRPRKNGWKLLIDGEQFGVYKYKAEALEHVR